MAQPEFMENLNRVNTAKENIKEALIKQGQNASDDIEDYANLVKQIGSPISPMEFNEMVDLADDILGIE